eukprot:c29322_g1_i2 orf=363-5285(-)
MAKQLDSQLAEIGNRLAQPTSGSKDALIKSLKHAASLLSEVDQSPPPNMVSAMKPSMDALVQPVLLNHKDKEVRLLVATCISEIMRIVAPDAPYSDEILKEIFQLIVENFQGLNEMASSSFARRVSILETVAKVRSCVVMLDLECDDLILEMFQAFFRTASEEHPQNVLMAMKTIMSLVIEESEDIPQPLLDVLLTNLLQEKKGVSPAAHQLAMSVFQRCAEKLEPCVQRFLTSVMFEGNALQSALHEDYHELIYEIYQCAPQMLVAVIPNLTAELLTVEVDVRVKAVELLGRLFALPGQLPNEYRQLFSEFLKRFTDKAIEVRHAVIECAKKCLLAKPYVPEAQEILTALNDRLQDFRNEVRTHVVASICDLVKAHPKHIPMDIMRRVAERLRDKKVFVRKDTLQRLTEVYRTLCLKCFEGSFVLDESFDWIPMKILRCCFDKDCKEFRPQAIELVFTEELFPSELPVVDRTKHWISIFATFDRNDEKAFERILLQKQRLQHEMQNYLLLRQKIKEEDSQEAQKRLQNCCKAMSSSFVDPIRAEDDFGKLNQLKDNNVLKALTSLLDSNLSLSEAESIRGELLRRLGDKHPQYEFMMILATKCSYMLFGKEHVHALLNEITLNKVAGKEDLLKASMGLLVEFAGHFPVLVEGSEEELFELLKEDNEHIKEGAVQILAKAGGSMRGQLDASGSVEAVLEKLCLEGNRKQAKYAVQALAAIERDSGLKALCGKLVDLLETTVHLPTILQSLGCIAQNAMSVFEAREDEVIQFVVRNLFRRDTSIGAGGILNGNDASEECCLKIYGLKALIRSFLPNKDAHLRQRIKGLFGVLLKVLECGEISDEVKSSEVDKGHLRLAAAKGVLRLSRRWDAQISPQLFHSTVLIAQDSSIYVRRQFLGKTHQYLKERIIPHKYACAFPLAISDSMNGILPEVKQYMVDFVESCRRDARSRQYSVSGHSDVTFITHYPEYLLFFLVHILAHHAAFPSLNNGGLSKETVEPFYKQLLFFIWALVRQEGEMCNEVNKKEELDNIFVILSIFRMVKQAEDAVDGSKSENSFILSDVGILITKHLLQNEIFSTSNAGSIPLPSMIYKLSESTEGATPKEDGSHLPTWLIEADLLARFQALQSELSLDVGLASSPGQKQGRINGIEEDSSSEGEPPQKRARHLETMEDGAEQDNGGVPIVMPVATTKSSFGRKRTPKDKPSKSADAVSDLPDTGADTLLEEAVPLSSKRKRGRSSRENGVLSSPEQKRGRLDLDNVVVSSEKRKRGRPKVMIDTENDGRIAAENPGLPLESLPASQDTLPSDKSKLSGVLGGKPIRLSVKKSKLSNDTLSGEVAKSPVPQVESMDVSKQGTRHSRKNMESQHKSAEKPASQVAKSPRGTPRTTKKTGISGLENTPESKLGGEKVLDDKLVGAKIKVWWPLDKAFYEGVVDSYDPVKQKHKVIYNDGDVEVLTLSKEHWKLVGEDISLPEVQQPSSPSTPSESLLIPKSRKKSTPGTVKPKVKRDVQAASPTRGVGSPRRRKNTSVMALSPTKRQAETLESKEEEGHAATDLSKAEGNEHEIGKETDAVTKGSPKTRRRSLSVKVASESLPQIQSPKQGLDSTSSDDRMDAASSPASSKDSDDIPLNKWKSRTRKLH